MVVIAFGGSFIFILWRASTPLGLDHLPSITIKKEDFQVVFSNATAEDVDFAKKKFVRVRRKQIDQMAAISTESNSAYAGAIRLQRVIDSLDEDSILVNLCTVDDRALINEVINDASRVNTGLPAVS